MDTDEFIIDVAGLTALLAELRFEGYELIGPTVRDQAIVLAPIAGIQDLPRGVSAEQEAGRYRLQQRTDGAFFGFAVGPQSLKPYVFPPRSRMIQLRREGASFSPVDSPASPPAVALLGVRACDLAALAIQDRVFLEGAVPDPDYAARRRGLFLIAVQCGVAGGTCFCVSMNTGPRAATGFDLALTELLDGEQRFLVEVGSRAGRRLQQKIPHAVAKSADLGAAREVSARTARAMGRSLPTDSVQILLRENLEHPRWDEVAARCLSCANCTMVCPTCFCHTVEDTTDLTGEHAERWRRWDSCFTTEHSHVHGGLMHQSVKSRYRQWLTHKLSYWIDQFGVSGCVGCGRCISWCPVGIDLTAEVAAIHQPRDEEPNVNP
jgi:sulfhydrogenase subunit beta (sulfur reductase)